METKFHELQTKLAVSPGEALFMAGYSGSVAAGQKSASNLQSRGVYPFRIRHLQIGGRAKKIVLIDDIEAALRGDVAQPPLPDEVSAPVQRRGRPRKNIVAQKQGGAA